jgi:HlyD family secretion protein
MTVADLSMMEARVDVGENDIITISIGDTARITIDAYPDKKFVGTVYEIANTAKSKGLGTQDEVTNFEVKIRVLNKDISLRPGMSMTADIETETKVNILAVPIQSVTTRVPKPKEGDKKGEGDKKEGNKEEGKQGGFSTNEKPVECVFLVENGKAKMVQVKRGINDEGFVEITSGLTDDGQVVSGSYKAINRELEDESVVKVENSKAKFALGKQDEKK